MYTLCVVCVYVYVYKQARRWAGPMVESQSGASNRRGERPGVSARAVSILFLFLLLFFLA